MLRPAALRTAAAAPRRLGASTTSRPSSFVNAIATRSLTTQSTETTSQTTVTRPDDYAKVVVQNFLSTVEADAAAALDPTKTTTIADAAAARDQHERAQHERALRERAKDADTIWHPSGQKVTEALTSAITSAKHIPGTRPLTYRVERTKSGNLSVYNDSKSGGTRKFTIIQRIEGNRQDLKKHIIAELGFKKEDVNVNPVTGSVTIKVRPNMPALWRRPSRPTSDSRHQADTSYRTTMKRGFELGSKPVNLGHWTSKCTIVSAGRYAAASDTENRTRSRLVRDIQAA